MIPLHHAANGDRLAYLRTEGCAPGVIFLGGFRSEMTGEKASALEAHCRAQGRAFLRFDYHAHGASEGDFRQGTISRWLGNALEMLDALSEGPQILAGSSMGGWLMLLLALARRDRVAGLLGIAAAPDFTEDLMWARLSREQQALLVNHGEWMTPAEYGEPYPLMRALIEDGRLHLMLKGKIPLDCPVRLLHGEADTVVPWSRAFRLTEALQSAEVQLTLLKNADHRLSTPPCLEELTRTFDALLREVEKSRRDKANGGGGSPFPG